MIFNMHAAERTISHFWEKRSDVFISNLGSYLRNTYHYSLVDGILFKKILNLLYFYRGRANLTNRIVWTLLIEVVIFVVTIVLAMVDSSLWPGLFFYLTIGSVTVINSKLFFHETENHIGAILVWRHFFLPNLRYIY